MDVCIVSDLSALIWSVLLICCSPAGAVRVCFCGDRSFLTSPINLEGKMEGCILFLRSVSEHSWVWSFILECCFSHFTFNCNLARFRNKEVAKCFQSNWGFPATASILDCRDVDMLPLLFPIVTSQQAWRWNVNSQSPMGMHVKVNFEFLSLHSLLQIYSEAISNRKNATFY